jgi:hypothetical protein
VRLDPYDLVAASFPAPRVRFSEPRVQFPPNAAVDLTRRVHDLGTRLRQLTNPPSWNMLANPGFEQPAKAGQIPGWLMTRQQGVAVEVIAGAAAVGRQSVSITSEGPVASLVSEWFDVPRTGRLAIVFASRIEDKENQPPLWVGIETREPGGDDPSQRFQKWMSLGAPPAVVPLNDRWGKFIVPFDSIGSATGSEIRIRFDLMAPGRVHVDDVQLFHLRFSPNEQVALTRIVALASALLREERLADCARLLDGYWPRFLFNHVPPGGGLAAQRDGHQQHPEAARDKPESPGVLDRLKKLKPF